MNRRRMHSAPSHIDDETLTLQLPLEDVSELDDSDLIALGGPAAAPRDAAHVPASCAARAAPPGPTPARAARSRPVATPAQAPTQSAESRFASIRRCGVAVV